MITASAYQVFPVCPSYGFRSRPDYLVKIISRESGIEKRSLKWSKPLHFYEGFQIGPRQEEDAYAMLEFYHSMNGTASRFRFIDYADYKTVAPSVAISPIDQPLQLVSTGVYQLIKRYDYGSNITDRPIIHPKGSTIRISNNSGVEQASSTWTINEDTGRLTVTGGFSGTPAAWGGEFYVPCRFMSLETSIIDKEIYQLDISVKEIRV